MTDVETVAMRYSGKGAYQGYDMERKRPLRAEDGDVIAVGPATAARLELDFPGRFTRLDAMAELHSPSAADRADAPAARVNRRKPARPRVAKGGEE